ncbi:MAG: OmpA family protein [Bacteroidota bacterium]|nr:OmpA family protein [Bacteroidota bacterium]
MKPYVLPLLLLLLLPGVTDAQEYQRYSHGAMRLGLLSGVNIGGEEATRKYAEYTPHPFGMLGLQYFAANRFALTGSLYAGTLAADFSGRVQFPEFARNIITRYDTKYYGAMLGAGYALPPFRRFTAIGRLHLGGMVHHTRVNGEGGFDNRITKSALLFGFGGAVDYPLAPALSLTFAVDLLLSNSDYLDGLRSGEANDALALITIGLNFQLQPGEEEPVRARAYAARKRDAEKSAEGDAEKALTARQRLPTEGMRQTESLPVFSVKPSTQSGDAASGDAASGEAEAGDAPFAGEPVGEHGRPGRPAGSPDEQGLVLRTEAPPEEITASRNMDNLPLTLYTQLFLTPLRRLRDLEEKPELFTLKVWQTGGDEMQLKSYVEILRDGRAIYQGNADLLLDGPRDQFTAEEFLDLPELLLRNQGDALLPRGNYVVRISTVAWDQELSSLAQGKFLNIDLRPIFGTQADDARNVIISRAVDVAAEGSEELLVNFFKAGRSAVQREAESGSRRANRLREPLPLAPIGTVGARRDALLAEEVQHSFTEALKLQNMAGSSGRTENLHVIVSEVYFPIDEEQLTGEARSILDNVARHLNQHPEQFAEIRGYANDLGDETYNDMLARKRAERVLEYLVRQRIHAYRVSVATVESEAQAAAPNRDPRLGRRVEIVLRNRGM